MYASSKLTNSNICAPNYHTCPVSRSSAVRFQGHRCYQFTAARSVSSSASISSTLLRCWFVRQPIKKSFTRISANVCLRCELSIRGFWIFALPWWVCSIILCLCSDYFAKSDRICEMDSIFFRGSKKWNEKNAVNLDTESGCGHESVNQINEHLYESARIPLDLPFGCQPVLPSRTERGGPNHFNQYALLLSAPSRVEDLFHLAWMMPTRWHAHALILGVDWLSRC